MINTKYTKYTKELLEPIVKESKSVRDVLIRLNLKPNGMHNKIKKLISEYGLTIEKQEYSGKYPKEMLEKLTKESNSISQVLIKLGLEPVGGTHSYITKLIKKWNINIEHFTGQGWNKGIKNWIRKINPDDILIERKDGNRTKTIKLRSALKEIGREHICQVCNQIPIWNNKPLVLEIDHINGNWLDDRRENLRFICPNCHTQTERYEKNKRK